MSVSLDVLQKEHKIWVDHNFPDQISHHGLLGVVEEVGELSHAHLKREQNIRGTDEKHQLDIEDAIGDIVIYLASYCNTNGIDFDECVRDAWEEVKARDWQANPEDGVVVPCE